MTRDFIDEFTDALLKEKKLFVIAIFPEDMNSSFTSHNLDDAIIQQQTFSNGKTISIHQSAVMAIQFSLGLDQGPAQTEKRHDQSCRPQKAHSGRIASLDLGEMRRDQSYASGEESKVWQQRLEPEGRLLEGAHRRAENRRQDR
jgi:hypothetical protein